LTIAKISLNILYIKQEGCVIMELLKFFIKDEVPAVGLSKFKDKKDEYSYNGRIHLNFNKPIFKPNYSKNFFLL
jgi:hypothetical protein